MEEFEKCPKDNQEFYHERYLWEIRQQVKTRLIKRINNSKKLNIVHVQNLINFHNSHVSVMKDFMDTNIDSRRIGRIQPVEIPQLEEKSKKYCKQYLSLL